MDRSERAAHLPQQPAEEDVALLDENLRLLGDRADRFVAHFYATLFLENPQLRGLFPESMEVQRDRFYRALTQAVRGMGDHDRFLSMLGRLGREHRRFGVLEEHYPSFGEALITAVAKYSEDVWVPELEAAWRRAYDYIAAGMVEGARQSALTEPAWWEAELVSHERRAADIAVLIVRPDAPYPYTPGQYASVETSFRPRSWRTYSMATAESPDGLLEFHVRAVGAGYVSGPLVWRAAVGDRLRLGPPQGEMAIDKQSRRDVLCLAGGTGLAPIKAMIDEMTRWNTSRRVTLLLGAREPADLYDLDALHRLAGLNPWLTVIPCLSETTEPGAEHGTLADVVALESWTEHDVFVCGSPSMMRATLGRLRELGIPESRISYDDPGDPHPVTAQVIDLRRSRAGRARSSARR